MIPFKKFIITGEHFYKKPKQDSHIFFWELQNKINNYVPLTFSSSLYVEDIGTFSRNEVINGCFIGTSYKPDWVSDLPNIKYITNYNNNFPEDERIKIFLSSKIAAISALLITIPSAFCPIVSKRLPSVRLSVGSDIVL